MCKNLYSKHMIGASQNYILTAGQWRTMGTDQREAISQEMQITQSWSSNPGSFRPTNKHILSLSEKWVADTNFQIPPHKQYFSQPS